MQQLSPRLFILLVLAALLVPACSDSDDEATPLTPSPEIVALIDQWWDANGAGDGSVLDLYVDEGYHLYGDQRYEYDQIPGHLSASGIQHEWVTEPLLIAEDADGRYVVVRGVRNSSGSWENTSAMLFEIVTTPEDELKIVQTAWFYDSEW